MALPGSSRSRNQSRSCAKDSGSAPVRSRRHHRRQHRQLRAAHLLHAPGQLRHRGRLEQRPQRQLHPERLADARDHPRGQQRVPAQLEEVVVHAPPAPAPSTSAQIPASTSSTGVRGATYRSSAAASSGAGSALRSSLPLGVSGSASSSTNAAGTMYSGRLAPQVRPQRLRLAPRPPRTPPAAARPARPRARPPRVAHAGVRAQRRLDLARLDAEAAHLHLVVQPPQELQRPVRPPAHPVARAVQPRARLPENGSGTKRSAVSAGRPR